MQRILFAKSIYSIIIFKAYFSTIILSAKNLFYWSTIIKNLFHQNTSLLLKQIVQPLSFRSQENTEFKHETVARNNQ